MSSKGKKHGDKQLGFLRPTVASQGRSNKQCNRTVPVPSQKTKKKVVKKKSKFFGSSTSPSRSTSSLQQNLRCTIPSAVEVYGEKTKSGSKHSLFGLSSKEHEGLNEARKMCEELKEQIDDLKLHQEAYEERLKRSQAQKFNGYSFNNSKHSKFGDPATSNGTSDENLLVKNLGISPSFTETSNPVIRVNVNKKEKPFQDSSNLPAEELSYNSLFFRPDASESIIKKLNSERDRYKRKVIKLQQELKLIKKQKNAALNSPEISLHNLSFYNADMIGEGRLAVVYEGTLNGKPVAVKKLVRSGVMTSSDRSYLAAEAGLLLPLQHHNVVGIFGVCSTPMEPLIVTEFVNGKTLAHMLHKSGGGLDPATFFSIARDVAIGLAYLHSQKPPVLHLNLRPSNVLVDSFLRAKVADFGFSKIRIDAGVSNCSNLAYLAPELLKFPAQITIKTDVYAYAILMWHMTTGKDPMGNRTTSQILDMLEHDQLLRIRTDLPVSIQQLISTCWDRSPGQRPTFKEIIIEYETMILPEEWIVKLKDIGVIRTDTSDMCSNTRDTASLSSSTTTASHPHEQLQGHSGILAEGYMNSTKKNFRSPQRSKIAPQHQTRTSLPLRRTDELADDVAVRQLSEMGRIRARRKQDSPTPLRDVRYVSDNLQNHINKPEIMPQKPGTSWEERHSKLRFSALHDERSTGYAARSAWYEEQYAGDTRPIETSKFDNKFRDYVSDACQAESTHKVHTSHRNWSNLPSSSFAQKSKSLLSSENIQVHSVGTQSTMASSSKSSSLDTAVYVPDTHKHHTGINGGLSGPSNLDSLGLSSAPNERILDTKFEPSLSRAVVNNAKRLLSSSPLHNYTKPVSKSLLREPRYTPHLDSRPLPEYRPRYVDHKRLGLELGYVRSESSKSDMSIESFLPLPPKLKNHQCLLLNDSPTHKSDSPPARTTDHTSRHGSRTSENMSVEINAQGSEDQGLEEDKSNKVSRILTQTAEELHNASSMLYSASAELRKQKLNGTF